MKEGKNREVTSVFFNAVFGLRHREIVFYDNWVDGNILENRKLRKIINAELNLDIEILLNLRWFYMATYTTESRNPTLVCERMVSIDIELHIRRGSDLILRNLKWLVTDQKLAEPLVGRKMLQALGLRTYSLLYAAVDIFSGIVDAQIPLGTLEEHVKSRVPRVFEGRFHEDGKI